MRFGCETSYPLTTLSVRRPTCVRLLIVHRVRACVRACVRVCVFMPAVNSAAQADSSDQRVRTVPLWCGCAGIVGLMGCRMWWWALQARVQNDDSDITVCTAHELFRTRALVQRMVCHNRRKCGE